MKDWHVFVVMGVITFVFLEFVMTPQGSIVLRVGRIILEVLQRIG